MQKLIFLLFLLPVTGWSQFTITQSQIDSLKAVNDLKYKFVVSFDRMMYEYEIRKSYERTDSIQKAIIAGYAKLTGIQAKGTEELKKAYETKVEADALSKSALDIAIEAEKKANRRKVAWKTVNIIGIPVAVAGGVYLGLLIK